MRTKVAEFPRNVAPELDAAFASGNLITVCWEPGCKRHRLPHWREKEWVARPQEKGDPNYSHSICRSHCPVYQQEV